MGISKRTKWHVENIILLLAIAACFVPKYGIVWNIAFYLMEK